MLLQSLFTPIEFIVVDVMFFFFSLIQASTSTAFVSSGSGFLVPQTEPSDEPTLDVTKPALDEDLTSGNESSSDEVYLY